MCIDGRFLGRRSLEKEQKGNTTSRRVSSLMPRPTFRCPPGRQLANPKLRSPPNSERDLMLAGQSERESPCISSPQTACTTGQRTPLFRKAKRAKVSHISALLLPTTSATLDLLQQRGYLNIQGEIVDNPLRDDLFRNFESIYMATRASIAGKIAFGPNAGQKVTRQGAGFGYAEETPMMKGRLCCTMNGFSLHAARAINTHNTKGLEQLISYIAPGPFSNDRLTLLPGGKVKLALKRPFSDGSTHLIMTHGEFIEKLAAMIPPPKNHLVR